MRLNKGIKKVCLLFTVTSLITTSLIAAPVTEKKELDVNYAISMAIGMDDTLGKYSRDLEVYKEQKKTMDNLSSSMYSSKMLDIAQTETRKQYRKDVITKEVIEAYQNVTLLQKNIELLKEKISLDEKQVKQVAIKKEKGFSNELEYEKAVQTLDGSKTAKEQAEKNLEDAKKSFLKLTNLNLDNYTLKVDDTYEPFVLDKSISSYASGMATELVKYAQQRAELNEDSFWDNIYQAGEGGTGPTYAFYLEQKTNIQNEKESVKSGYDTYKVLIETKYTALSAQLDTIKIKADDYKTSIRDMKALEIRYKAGYISNMDYEKQKYAIDAKQVEYLNEVYKYNILKMQFEKPWTMNEYAF